MSRRSRAPRDRGGFAKTHRTHPLNIAPPPMRGGTRL